MLNHKEKSISTVRLLQVIPHPTKMSQKILEKFVVLFYRENF